MAEQIAKFFLSLPELAARIGVPDGQEITMLVVQTDPPALAVYVRGQDLTDNPYGWPFCEAPYVEPPPRPVVEPAL